MVKSYFRYEPSQTFGIISSQSAQVIYDSRGKLAIAPAIQNVIVWNIRQGTKVQEFHGESGEVTCLTLSSDGDTIAAGGSLKVTLDGHKSSVGSLHFSEDNSLLVSGSRDTDIIVWDIVSQTGLYRLRGHKDEVTGVHFLKNTQYVVSISKDTLLKVWELETQHCIQTCVGHRSEIWCLDIDPAERRIATGASDNQIRIWTIGENFNEEKDQLVEFFGSVYRQSNERCSSIYYNCQGNLLGCQGAGKSVEVYRVRNESEIKKKVQRRLKRRREKQRKQQGDVQTPNEEDCNPKESGSEGEDDQIQPGDELELLTVLRSNHKIRSFEFSPQITKDNTIDILLGLHNNSIEEHRVSSINASMKSITTSKVGSLVLQGHRSDIRATCISSNDQMLVSVSSSLVKVWNCKSMECIRTMATTLGLCVAFLPGNKHVVVGSKNGELTLFDLSSGDSIFNEKAHDGAIWSLDVAPDGSGIVTGGADHQVKFWDLELVHDSQEINSTANENKGVQEVNQSNNMRRLALVHTRTLEMADDVLCVRYSHNKDKRQRLVAVALLDCTVKIFYDDSLKFFLSLYGHKLPVMSMDISSDDSMIVTASADKNVKIWGLDFGDCHKSIFAHDQSVMCVRFVHGTHYFFTSSKDSTIRYWDGDHFEKIISLEGHLGEVWAIAVSQAGDFLISVSHDRSLRKWVRTEDQVFLEEEREKEMEKMFEDELNTQSKSRGDHEESVSAGKSSVITVMAGEKLMEAIELADAELRQQEEYEKTKANSKAPAPRPNIILQGYSPRKYILKTLRSIRLQELEEALLVLSFNYVERLFEHLLHLISKGLDIELCSHCVLVLLRVHHKQIVANHSLLDSLHNMWSSLRSQLIQHSDRIGFNLAGLQHLKRQMDQKNMVYIDENSTSKNSKEPSKMSFKANYNSNKKAKVDPLSVL